MGQEENFSGKREDDSASEKEYIDDLFPPEWRPHCAPRIFGVSFNAGQSRMLDWVVEDLWSTPVSKASSGLNSLRTPEAMFIRPVYEVWQRLLFYSVALIWQLLFLWELLFSLGRL